MQKATLEHIFKPDHGDVDMEAAASSSAGSVAAPWSVGWQINERNMMWNDDLKLRLIKVHSRVRQHSSVHENSMHENSVQALQLSGSVHPLLHSSQHLEAVPAAGHLHYYLCMQLLHSGMSRSKCLPDKAFCCCGHCCCGCCCRG
jgi:hypothetical protein